MRSGSMPDILPSSLESLSFSWPPEEFMSLKQSLQRLALLPNPWSSWSVHNVEDVLGKVRETLHVRLCLSSHHSRW